MALRVYIQPVSQGAGSAQYFDYNIHVLKVGETAQWNTSVFTVNGATSEGAIHAMQDVKGQVDAIAQKLADRIDGTVELNAGLQPFVFTSKTVIYAADATAAKAIVDGGLGDAGIPYDLSELNTDGIQP